MAFKKALKTSVDLLHELEAQKKINYCLIGGVAVSSWGAIRATADLDFWVVLLQNLSIEDVAKKIDKISSVCEIKKGDIDDPVPALIDSVIDGVSVQFILAVREWEKDFIQSAVHIDLENATVNILGLEELIVLKIWAGGPQDLYDAKRLLALNPNQEAVAKRAKQIGVLEGLKKLTQT